HLSVPLRHSFPTRRSSDLANREVGTFSPLRKLLVQWMPNRLNAVSQRLEDPVHEPLTGPHRQHFESSCQRKRLLDQLRSIFTPRSEEHTSELQSRENLVCR